MKLFGKRSHSGIVTVIAFSLLWPVFTRAFGAFVVAPAIERPRNVMELVTVFTHALERGMLGSVVLGFIVGAVLGPAGLQWGKPPYWTILLVAAAVASLPWILDTGDRSTGLEGMVMIAGTIIGGVGVLVLGLLSRLLWSGDNR